MPDDPAALLPRWAPRLPKAKIAQLYRSSRQGLLDEDMVDEVGYLLRARCVSMLQVMDAMRGTPHCPSCGEIGRRDRQAGLVLCDACGWSAPWEAYKKTYQRRGLFAGGLEPYVREFVERFDATNDRRQRMVLIDTLIHRFHWESGDEAGGRPGATSLIEGKLKNIMPFLDGLSYGEAIPLQVARNREAWRKKWTSSPWSQGMGQGSPTSDGTDGEPGAGEC